MRRSATRYLYVSALACMPFATGCFPPVDRPGTGTSTSSPSGSASGVATLPGGGKVPDPGGTWPGKGSGQGPGGPGNPGNTGPDSSASSTQPDKGSETKTGTGSGTDSGTGTGPSHPNLQPSDPFVPRFDAMWLSLTPGTRSAVLELGMASRETKYLATHGGKPALKIDPKGKASFVPWILEPVPHPKAPANNAGLDLKNLRVFRTQVELDPDQMSKILDEYSAQRTRSVARFFPGGHDVQARVEAPVATSQEFRAGRKVDLSLVSEMAPLAALGAVAVPVDKERSLMIRDLEVIEDPARTVNPCGPALESNLQKPWSFAHLMAQMAQGVGMSPSDFVESWLGTFSKEQQIRSQSGQLLDVISDETGKQIERELIEHWRARSGGGKLDLRLAPFRLLAILYRPDLGVASPLRNQQRNFAGELRFVFGMMQIKDNNQDGDALDATDTCRSLEAAVIMEYNVPRRGCHEIKSWANDVLKLSSMPIASAQYKDALQKLSHEVTRAKAAPWRRHQSALARLRTNEIEFSLSWQLREFELVKGKGLVPATIKDNPRNHTRRISSAETTPLPHSLNESDLFARELLKHLDLILTGRYVVPETTGRGEAMLGGVSSLTGLVNRWVHRDFEGPEQTRARFNLSVNTCGGCHTGETGTLFYHVFPAGMGQRTRFSPFLEDSPHESTFRTRYGPRETHEFDETTGRRQALHAMANLVCDFEGKSIPVQLMHRRSKNLHTSN